MNFQNRIESVPLLLFFVDFAFVISIIPFTAIIGAQALIYIVALPILAFSLGAYDFPTSIPKRSMNAHHYAALAVCSIYAIFTLVGMRRGLVRVGLYDVLFPVILLGFSMVRRFIIRNVISGTQRITLCLPPSLAPLTNTFSEYISSIGYPAELVSGSDKPVAYISSHVRTYLQEPESLEIEFDPVAFFNVVAKALPPDILRNYPDYFDLCRKTTTAYRIAKRLVDLVFAVILLLISLPVWLFAVIGILFTDGARVFFVQTRIGKGGIPFRVVKFRTLRPAPQKQTPTEDFEERAFLFGTFLRRMRIDELPQLLQVITGKMSLVGPRPEMIYYHERSCEQIPFYMCRLNVKPGLTGWAQVNYAHTTTEQEYWTKTAHDLWYIVNRSFFLDLKIILRTIGIVLERFGAK